MRCPYCGNDDTQVKDSRPTEDSSAIRRRRICPSCGGRFTTFERVQLRELVVIKRNGRLLSNIINDILDLSKVEAGKMEVSTSEVSVTDVRDTVEVLSVEIRGAERVPAALVRSVVATQATGCISAALQPVCWLGGSLDRHYLDGRTLTADLLRLRLFYHQRGFREARVELDIEIEALVGSELPEGALHILLEYLELDVAKLDRDHSPEPAHLPHGELVLRMVGESRVIDALHFGAVRQPLGDPTAVRVVLAHPQRERLGAAQREEAVHRARHRAGGVLEEGEPLGQRVVAYADESADHVGVPAEVLRRRVHDDVGAERQRLLQVRRGERVVHDHQRAALVGLLEGGYIPARLADGVPISNNAITYTITGPTAAVVTSAGTAAGIRPGDVVVLSWTAANRDPDRFGDPDAFRPEDNAPHNLVYGAASRYAHDEAVDADQRHRPPLQQLQLILSRYLGRGAAAPEMAPFVPWDVAVAAPGGRRPTGWPPPRRPRSASPWLMPPRATPLTCSSADSSAGSPA